ncbi:glycosyltransferase [Mammaliicoccus sciuri]|uniref:glycosyltransferase n=1 Tax=Mammaliicoccus sciuri TaxID=1296 RepID=UPI002DBFA8C7|nr:glycosyltransferase [Mammaliicoccus sciuri]MEB7768748.1 glycosyltransferase [Mammaliicoccus sciuri]MEB7818595.1 glycosyltransferase [Mammaliicoccus sciuri]
MKSITILIHNIYHFGGTSKSITNLANALAQNGHKVTIVSVVGFGKNPYYNLNKNIKVETIFNYRQISFKNLNDIIINRLNKYTPLFKPKILTRGEPNFKSFSSHIENRLIKYIATIKSDIIISTRASYNIILANMKIDCMKIGMEHMFYNAHNNILKSDIKQSYQKLDLITVLSIQDKQEYERLLPHGNIVYLPNIIDEPEKSFEKENIILAAGRLEFEKGFDLLIEAINEIQGIIRDYSYNINIYGDGSEKEDLINKIKKYKINDIVTIFPSTNTLDKDLSKSKITCVPSRVEGFGMVILEAMNQNSVVVSFDIGYGPSSLIRDGKNGLLANADDYTDYANNIKKLIINDQYLNSLLTEAKRDISKYSPENVYTILDKYIK